MGEATEALASEFNLAKEEREELLPSGQEARFSNRIVWATSYLRATWLIERTGRGRFRITDRGREAVDCGQPADLKYLAQYPEHAHAHRGDHHRHTRGRLATLLAVTAAITAACGFGGGQTSPGATTTPSAMVSSDRSTNPTASPTLGLTPSATASPTETPSPTATPEDTQEADGIHWWTDRGEERVVPKVNGLKAVLKNAGKTNEYIAYVDGSGKERGIFAKNFAVFDSDGTQEQTGIVMLDGAEVTTLLKKAGPEVMPLPYAVNEATGTVTLGFDNNGYESTPRAVVEIPTGDSIDVSVFDPNNQEETVAVEHSPIMSYVIQDFGFNYSSKGLGHFVIYGERGKGSADVTRDVHCSKLAPAGHHLTIVSGESSIVYADDQTGPSMGPVSIRDVLTTADGTIIGIR